MKELSDFFDSISRRSGPDPLELSNKVYFIFIKEFKWSYTQLMETPMSFIFDMLDARSKYIKEQEKQMKKR